MLAVITILLGIGLLFAGRKLFWLFVGAAGFMTGVSLVTNGGNASEPFAIIVGIVVGLIFAALAMFFKSLAIALAGFIGGGALALTLAGWFGVEGTLPSIIFYVIGGVIGIIVVGQLFDWAVIILSSIIGGGMVVDAINLDGTIAMIATFFLVLVGISVQARDMGDKKPKPKPNKKSQ